MQDSVVYVAIATAVLLVLLTAIYDPRRRSSRDVLSEELAALDTTALRKGNNPAEAARVEAQLDGILADHPHDVAQLRRTFEEVLAEVVFENPFVAPLFTRFDQTAAKQCHHQRCRTYAASVVRRNVRVLATIETIRAHICAAKPSAEVRL